MDYIKKRTGIMGLEDIPEPFLKYMKKEQKAIKSNEMNDMLFMLLIFMIVFDF